LSKFSRNVGLRGSLCLALCLDASLALCDQTPSGAPIAGLREAAKHRGPIEPVRSLVEFTPENEQIYVWNHLDAHGLVTETRPIGSKALFSSAVEKAASAVRYLPFTSNDRTTDAWVQDSIPLLPRERLPAETVPFPQGQFKDVKIELSRSGCFGSCPIYRIAIDGDGRVTYEGKDFVSITGIHRSHISGSMVAALLERFRDANFLALQSSYRASATDLPTYCLKLTIGSVEKTVEDYEGEWVGMPSSVTELENAVDTASDSARWVTSSPGTVTAMQEGGIGVRSPQAAKILRAAVEQGDLVTARFLLQAGTPADAHARHDYDNRPLVEIAVDLNGRRDSPSRLQMLQLVLTAPASRSDRIGMQRALGLAVEQGDADLAHALIQAGADPTARFDYSDDHRLTYLMLATASGSWEMLDDALARPHDIHAEDSAGRTALVWILWNAPPDENIFPIVDRLRAHGAPKSDLDKALLVDCNPNWSPGLVARGANVNARDKKGNTPLFQTCSVEGVKALLDAGADPTLRNAAGKTAIETTYAAQNGKPDPRAQLIREYMEPSKH
jgi:hypothetical protein